MQELLSKADNAGVSPSGQEFFELRLYDSSSAGEPVFCVREARAAWNDARQDFAWDKPRIEVFAILEEARERYAERRLALTQQGFVNSDMDLLP
jgi:hypothetical protein